MAAELKPMIDRARADIIALLGYVVGFGLVAGDALFPKAIDGLVGVFGGAPGLGGKLAAGFGYAAILAALIIRWLKNPTNAPATAVVQGAPIVPPGTVSVNVNTPVIATNTETKGSP